CAAYLARAGLKVRVQEARAVPGGACTTEELVPGGRFSPCAYIQMMLPREIIADLELEKNAFRSISPNPQEMALWPDGSHVTLWHAIDKTLRSIENHHAADGPNFIRFAMRLRRFCDLTHALQLNAPPSIEEIRTLFESHGELELFNDFFYLSAEELLRRYIDS